MKKIISLALAFSFIVSVVGINTEKVEVKEANAQENQELTITDYGDGGYEVELQNGELVLKNPDTPVYVENREKPGEQILSCGQKVRLSDGSEKTAYYKGKDEDWTAALGSNSLQQAGLTKEEFDSLFREKRGEVVGNEMTVYASRWKYKDDARAGFGCSAGEDGTYPDKTFLGWKCEDIGLRKDEDVNPNGVSGCCNSPGCSTYGCTRHMYSGPGRIWYRDECQEPELEDSCQDTDPPSLSGDTTFSNEKEAILTIQGGKGPFNDRNLILSGKENENGDFVSYYNAHIENRGTNEDPDYKVIIPKQNFNTDCGLKLKVVDACGNESGEMTVMHEGKDEDWTSGTGDLTTQEFLDLFRDKRGELTTENSQIKWMTAYQGNYKFSERAYIHYPSSCPEGVTDPSYATVLGFKCQDFGMDQKTSPGLECYCGEGSPINRAFHGGGQYFNYRAESCQPPQLPTEEEKECNDGERRINGEGYEGNGTEECAMCGVPETCCDGKWMNDHDAAICEFEKGRECKPGDTKEFDGEIKYCLEVDDKWQWIGESDGYTLSELLEGMGENMSDVLLDPVDFIPVGTAVKIGGKVVSTAVRNLIAKKAAAKTSVVLGNLASKVYVNITDDGFKIISKSGNAELSGTVRTVYMDGQFGSFLKCGDKYVDLDLMPSGGGSVTKKGYAEVITAYRRLMMGNRELFKGQRAHIVTTANDTLLNHLKKNGAESLKLDPEDAAAFADTYSFLMSRGTVPVPKKVCEGGEVVDAIESVILLMQ